MRTKLLKYPGNLIVTDAGGFEAGKVKVFGIGFRSGERKLPIFAGPVDSQADIDEADLPDDVQGIAVYKLYKVVRRRRRPGRKS